MAIVNRRYVFVYYMRISYCVHFSMHRACLHPASLKGHLFFMIADELTSLCKNEDVTYEHAQWSGIQRAWKTQEYGNRPHTWAQDSNVHFNTHFFIFTLQSTLSGKICVKLCADGEVAVQQQHGETQFALIDCSVMKSEMSSLRFPRANPGYQWTEKKFQLIMCTILPNVNSIVFQLFIHNSVRVWNLRHELHSQKPEC